jgi:peptidoglycan/xylan/chitin deacetylase (PgdA/CDA1 family)
MPASRRLRHILDLLHYSGAARAGQPLFGGIGAIFMLHHVRPGGGADTGFVPNRLLEVTPEFLDAVITLVKREGLEILAFADAVERIRAPRGERFVTFTLDDAYRDNLTHALPVFARHACPFTIFAAPAIQDGTCELWWRGLECVIRDNAEVMAEIGGETLRLATTGDARRHAAWKALYWPLRNLPEGEQRRWIRHFCTAHGFDLDAYVRAEAMSWDELRRMAAHPLCTIGGHTIHHYAVAKLTEAEAMTELVGCANRLEQELGQRPRFLAYPYGDPGSAGQRDFRLTREAGYEAAVTTRKGMVFAGHADHLTALPRLSLSGEFQEVRYVQALLTGTPFALLNRFRRLSVS